MAAPRMLLITFLVLPLGTLAWRGNGPIITLQERWWHKEKEEKEEENIV
jgi:hypothetical protein